MTTHRTGTREEWLRARLDLLEAEKELTRLNDDLAHQRRELPWASSGRSEFNHDFHVTIDEAVTPVEYNYQDQAELERSNPDWHEWSGEQPGMSAFARDDGVVYHTYSADARGLDALWSMWQWLDRSPLGRNEGDLSWFRRRDEYSGV